MGNIYRKIALDRLSSPEQLDKLVKITSPGSWIALVSLAVIIGAATIWAFFGSLPQKVDAGGIYQSNAENGSVYAMQSGMVNLKVERNEKVKKGQILAVITNPNLSDAYMQLEKTMDEIEKITLTSTEDAASSTSSAMLEIKTKLSITGLSVEQVAAQKQELEGVYANKTAKVNAAKAAYDSAADVYYQAVANDGLNAANIRYEQAKAALQASTEALKSATQSYNQVLAAWQSETDPDKKEQLASQLGTQDGLVANARANTDSANAEYSAAEQQYTALYTAQNAANANIQALSNDMSVKGSEYQQAVSERSAVEQSLNQLLAQGASNNVQAESDRKTLETQFEATKQATLSDIKQKIAEAEPGMERLEIIAPNNGEVTSFCVQDQQVVDTGMEVLRINGGKDVEEKQLVYAYVPVSEARKLSEGMRVNITPSTVEQDEYGYIYGKIAKVDKYNASTQDMKERLGDDVFVNSIQQKSGPTVCVTATLETDKHTASGYKWSSKNGARVELESGTIVQAQIITSEDPPISKLIPTLKKLLKVKEGEAAE